MRILIAGAGLSGLQAAWRLHQAGHDVVVFDARDRVGGRTLSTRLRNGVVVDHGALTIRAEDHALRGLCAELEIELIGIGFPVGRWECGLDIDRTIDEVDWLYEGLADRASARLAAGEPDESLEVAMAAVIGPDYLVNDTYLNTTAALGVPLGDLSAHGFSALYLGVVFGLGGEQHGGIVEHASRILGGNQRPSLELAARLGERVRLERVVTRVDQDETGVRFHFADGSTEQGDGAVLALPVALLRELDLGFEMPEAMRAAVDNLVVGDAAMVSVELDGATPVVCTNDPVDWWTMTNWASPADERLGELAMTAYLGTDRVIDEVLADGVLGRIRSARPDLVFPEEPEVLVTDWRRDPWARGAYPNWGVGWEPAMSTAFEQRVVGRVAVAGADTAGAFVGGMDGAVKAGQIAAQQLHDALAQR